MASKALSQFQNLIEVANNYRQYPEYYFFIKNYAFTKAFNTLSKDYSGVSASDRAIYENMSNEFKQERQLANPKILSKEEYVNFLEYYFKNIDFDHADLKALEVCRDLTEIIFVFGVAEELWTKRSK